MDWIPPLKFAQKFCERSDQLAERGLPFLACVLRRQKELSLQSWSRLLASENGILKAAWLVCKRYGMPRDLRRLMLWSYLGRFCFHLESKTLRYERILMQAQFKNFARQKLVMMCLRASTRFLRLETGDLFPAIRRSFTHAHVNPHQLSPCRHSGLWARVKAASEKSKVEKKKDVLE